MAPLTECLDPPHGCGGGPIEIFLTASDEAWIRTLHVRGWAL